MRDRILVGSTKLTLLILLLVCGGVIAASAAKLPANLLISPKASPHYVILVEKSSQRLSVYRFDGDYRLVASYGCATGENPGDKRVSGDRKTPLGIYFFTKAAEEQYLAPIYGSRAFPMDYPNYMDRRLNKQGNGIWVHGTNEELKERSTNGCVAMVNDDIVQLDSYIRLWDTPIIIEEKIKYEDPSKLRSQGLAILQRIEGWSQAWSQKDLDRYMSYYASGFRWKNLDLRSWRQRKASLNKRYREISVQLSDVRLFRHGDAVTATAEMIYRSDRFASHGFKRLYLVQNSLEWRILGEEWRRSSRPVPPPLRVAAKPAKPMRVVSKPPKPTESPEQSLHRFVQKWRRAWEKGDLPVYMACYHPRFKSQNMDRSAWKQYKKGLFKQSSERVVTLKDMNVKAHGPSARIVFKQEYSTERHQDFGQKTLRLRRHRGQWTILGETWKQLPDQG